MYYVTTSTLLSIITQLLSARIYVSFFSKQMSSHRGRQREAYANAWLFADRSRKQGCHFPRKKFFSDLAKTAKNQNSKIEGDIARTITLAYCSTSVFILWDDRTLDCAAMRQMPGSSPVSFLYSPTFFFRLLYTTNQIRQPINFFLCLNYQSMYTFLASLLSYLR